jgi:hypothetical protein
MTTIVNLPDKICPHCNGTKWITTSNKHICKNGNISIYHGYQCYTRNKENRLKQIDKKREDSKEYYKRYKANPENLKKIKERSKDRYLKYGEKYREKGRIQAKRYHDNNREKVINKKRENRLNLTDHYIKSTLVIKTNLKYQEVPKELIEIQRKSLQLKRKVWQNQLKQKM